MLLRLVVAARDERLAVGGAVTNGALDPTDVRPPVFTPLPWSEVPPACYDVAARIEAMDHDVLHARPTLGRADLARVMWRGLLG